MTMGCLFWVNPSPEFGDNNVHLTSLDDLYENLLESMARDVYPNERFDGLFCLDPHKPKTFRMFRDFLTNYLESFKEFDFENCSEGGQHFMLCVDRHGVLSNSYKTDLEKVKMVYTSEEYETAINRTNILLEELRSCF